MDRAILTSEYFLPISSLFLYHNCAEVLIETCENYQKKSTRNRAKIIGANGIENLSVPLKSGKNNKMPIQQVEISYDSDWVINHLQTIKSAYGNSPFYEFYIDDITELLESKIATLYELNSCITNFMLDQFDIETVSKSTLEYKVSYDQHSIDVRNSNYNKRVIPNYTPKRYGQVFEEKLGFVAGLSSLDMLMCKGPEGILYI